MEDNLIILPWDVGRPADDLVDERRDSQTIETLAEAISYQEMLLEIEPENVNGDN
jgi:hypothetical protein